MKAMWILIAVVASAYSSLAGDSKLHAAFIYVGPINDFGWTKAHDDARQQVQQHLPWLDTSYVESVAEGDLQSYIDLAIQAGSKVIFTTSATFVDGTIEAAARYPNIIFVNEGGLKRAPNVASYLVDAYQCYYLFGLMAGALTQTDKIGYVGTYPGPDVKRFINALTIGLRAAKPTAVVNLVWINSWYDPPAAKEAAEALIAQGVDVLASDVDSTTVVQVGGMHHLPVFGHNSAMYDIAPDAVVSGDINHLEIIFETILTKIHKGAWSASSLEDTYEWCRLSGGEIEFGARPGMPINPIFQDRLSKVIVDDGSGRRVSVYDLVLTRERQMAASAVSFEPFTGPPPMREALSGSQLEAR